MGKRQSLDQICGKLCNDRPPLSSHAEHHADIALRPMSLLLTAAVADRENVQGTERVTGKQRVMLRSKTGMSQRSALGFIANKSRR